MRRRLEPKERVNRASSMVVESIKRTVGTNIARLIQSGELPVDKKVIPGLVAVLAASVDQGYMSVYPDYMRAIDVALEESSAPIPTKKKRDEA